MAKDLQRKTYLVVSVALLVAMVTPVLCEEEEAEPALKIDPPEVAKQVGEETEFTCTNNNETINETLVWLNRNGTEISKLNNSRFTIEDGMLKITDIRNEDAGEYVCTYFTSRSLEAKVKLKVYEMPSYLIEGLVLMAINVALVLVFLACAVWRLVQTRKEKKRKKNEKLYPKA